MIARLIIATPCVIRLPDGVDISIVRLFVGWRIIAEDLQIFRSTFHRVLQMKFDRRDFDEHRRVSF